MTSRWARLDPRHPAAAKIVAGIADPEMELATRIALTGLCRKARGDRAWQRRCDELRASLIRSADDLTAIMAKGAQMRRLIVEELEQGAL